MDAAAGEGRAALALDVFVHRVRRYLGAYLVELGGRVDAVVFSAGIGENSAEVRQRVCQGLEWAGVAVDAARNGAAVGPSGPTEIQAVGSRVKVLVIPTDEELSIAEQTLEVVGAQGEVGAPGRRMAKMPPLEQHQLVEPAWMVRWRRWGHQSQRCGSTCGWPQ